MESSMIVLYLEYFQGQYSRQKHVETIAEKYVDVCADFGTDDTAFRDAMGSCDFPDAAIFLLLRHGRSRRL